MQLDKDNLFRQMRSYMSKQNHSRQVMLKFQVSTDFPHTHSTIKTIDTPRWLPKPSRHQSSSPLDFALLTGGPEFLLLRQCSVEAFLSQLVPVVTPQGLP